MCSRSIKLTVPCAGKEVEVALEVAPSEALRMHTVWDEQNFVRSAAVECITVSSGAGKTEIPVKLTAP